MDALKSFAAHNPVWFVLIVTVAWFVLALVFMGIASGVLRKPMGGADSLLAGRLAVTVCVLVLLWQMGWLEGAGVGRLGSWQAWLLALGGLLYAAGASLYAFYGKVAFDTSSLAQPQARGILTSVLVGGASEEILFRGLVLYALLRAWGNTPGGLIGAVVLSALLFAVLHLMQVFANKLSPTAALLLVLQTVVTAIWWGALTAWGGSLWPAVLLHVTINAVLPLQGLVTPAMEPESIAYQRLLWLSLPLGALGLGLLGFAAPRVIPPEGG